eukprot:CAMPEP_0205901524 /NCGR_PEP_ID=MMETSP1083-20121108/27730_1 /ASSEMBLY_ACC=CAM_ASM_000430 /TAXON_ID=97485 /ORGANISM="Prymnesium parvum, Strain Texoma1" /LENGTH=109 /DNA_ID=CAMNT_0053267063 /DNA_START=207 /DNA_END=534 /DNA_ORIENTATION=-
MARLSCRDARRDETDEEASHGAKFISLQGLGRQAQLDPQQYHVDDHHKSKREGPTLEHECHLLRKAFGYAANFEHVHHHEHGEDQVEQAREHVQAEREESHPMTVFSRA